MRMLGFEVRLAEIHTSLRDIQGPKSCKRAQLPGVDLMPGVSSATV